MRSVQQYHIDFALEGEIDVLGEKQPGRAIGHEPIDGPDHILNRNRSRVPTYEWALAVSRENKGAFPV